MTRYLTGPKCVRKVRLWFSWLLWFRPRKNWGGEVLAKLIWVSYGRGQFRQTKAVVQINLSRHKNTRKARKGPKNLTKHGHVLPIHNFMIFCSIWQWYRFLETMRLNGYLNSSVFLVYFSAVLGPVISVCSIAKRLRSMLPTSGNDDYEKWSSAKFIIVEVFLCLIVWSTQGKVPEI